MIRIRIDTREQRPWAFPEGVETIVGTIQQGDYALDGDNTFAVERKSLDDFVGTVFQGWERFQRELRRMDDCGFCAKVIIVEGDFDDVCFKTIEKKLESGEKVAVIREPQHNHPAITPEAVCAKIAELIVRYRCCVLFARDEGTAASMCFHVLCKRAAQLNGRIG